MLSKLSFGEVFTIHQWVKHLNLGGVAGLLDPGTAAKMAGHTSTVITLKHYLINEEERIMENLRKVNNDFA